MKKIIAVAAAVMVSFSAQAQDDEWHVENSAIIAVCAADSEVTQADCKSTMIGFKLGFLHAIGKGAYIGYFMETNDKKGALKVSEGVRANLAQIVQQIDSNDMILEYVSVLKQNKHYRSLPADYALGQALTNLMNKAK